MLSYLLANLIFFLVFGKEKDKGNCKCMPFKEREKGP